MGVNMIGFAIEDQEASYEASKAEVIRRYYEARKLNFLGKFKDSAVSKEEVLMNQLGLTIDDRKCVKPCLDKQEETGVACVSIELPNGEVVVGKTSTLLRASSAALLNALKVLGKIDDSFPLLSPSVIEPIQKLKVESLRHRNPRLHAEEVLIALAIQGNSNPLASVALKQLPKLKGCQAHSSVILQEVDYNTFKKLGIEITEEPVSYARRLYKGK